MNGYRVEERQFINHYMLIREIETIGNRRRFLGEEMRQDKEVWIDVYPASGNNAIDPQEIRRLIQMAEKVQKIDASYIRPIYDLVYGDETFCIVSEPPTGFPLSKMGGYNGNSIKIIVAETVRLLQWLQNHGFGINRLSPDEIYFSVQKQSFQLIFDDAFCLRQLHESREAEIRTAGEMLFWVITEQKWHEGSDIDQILTAANLQEWGILLSLMLEGKNDQKVHRIEELFPFMETDSPQDDTTGNQSTPILTQTAPSPKGIWLLSLAAAFLLYFGFVQIQSGESQKSSSDSPPFKRDESRIDPELSTTPATARESHSDKLASPKPLPSLEVEQSQQENTFPVTSPLPTERFQPLQMAPYALERVERAEPHQEVSKKPFQPDIMWQDNDDVIRLKMTWNEATRYCENLHLNGYEDWGLPDKELLFDLFFEQPDLQFVANDLYWTSSEVSSDTAWRIYFNYSGGKNRQGNMSSNLKSDRWFVRCYRPNR